MKVTMTLSKQPKNYRFQRPLKSRRTYFFCTSHRTHHRIRSPRLQASDPQKKWQGKPATRIRLIGIRIGPENWVQWSLSQDLSCCCLFLAHLNVSLNRVAVSKPGRNEKCVLGARNFSEQCGVQPSQLPHTVVRQNDSGTDSKELAHHHHCWDVSSSAHLLVATPSQQDFAALTCLPGTDSERGWTLPVDTRPLEWC